MFSDLFVVKGIGIGHEIVSVYLHEPQLDNLTDKIVLTVAEAMSLDPPSPVLVLVGATVQYTLKVISENIPQGFFLTFSLVHMFLLVNVIMKIALNKVVFFYYELVVGYRQYKGHQV